MELADRIMKCEGDGAWAAAAGDRMYVRVFIAVSAIAVFAVAHCLAACFLWGRGVCAGKQQRKI